MYPVGLAGQLRLEAMYIRHCLLVGLLWGLPGLRLVVVGPPSDCAGDGGLRGERTLPQLDLCFVT